MAGQVMLRMLTALLIMCSLVNGYTAAAAPNPGVLRQITLDVDTDQDSLDNQFTYCLNKVPRDCSLRGAVACANADRLNTYVILIPAGTYTFALSGDEDRNLAGDLDILANMDLQGAGIDQTWIDGGALDRVVHVHPGVRVQISNLTLTGGVAPPAQDGGGLLNEGELALSHVRLFANHAGDGQWGEAGGSGGAISNRGTLSLLSCTLEGNSAGSGGGVHKEPYVFPVVAGSGGGGGGISNSGVMDIFNSVLQSNQAGDGGSGGDCDAKCDVWAGAYGGRGGRGGGIVNHGWMVLEDTRLFKNEAGRGGNGAYGFVAGGNGGAGGCGGGIASAGQMIVQDSQVFGNYAGNAGLGGDSDYKAGPAPGGDPGCGGGVYNSSQASISGTLISTNATGEALLDRRYHTGGGGGIYLYLGSVLELQDSQVQDNQASGRGGGIFNFGTLNMTAGLINGNHACQQGGGIYNSGVLQAIKSEINANRSGPGYDGYIQPGDIGGPYPPTAGESPDGGGVFNQGTAILNLVEIIYNQAGRGGKGANGYLHFPGADGGDGGSGAGIFNKGELRLNWSWVQHNHAGQGGAGGAAYLDRGAGANGLGGSGGGIYNAGTLQASDVRVADNESGAGFSELEVGGQGGGVFNRGSLTLWLGELIGNRTAAGGNGGGLYLSGTDSIPIISSTQVISNTAAASGGGIYLAGADSQMDSLVVAANRIGEAGAGSGIFLADATHRLRQLTLADNLGGDGSGVFLLAATAAFTNTIVARQAVGLSLAEGASARLQATLWGAGEWANGANWSGGGELDAGSLQLSADPLFIDSFNHNYHLQDGSPARNAGVPGGLAADLDDQPRPEPPDGLPDLGADEVWTFRPVDSVRITAPSVIPAGQPVTFLGEITPPDATPHVRYFWQPEPDAGQWTAQPVFIFKAPGLAQVTVWAKNAGSTKSSTLNFTVYRYIYLPAIWR